MVAAGKGLVLVLESVRQRPISIKRNDVSGY